MHKVQLKREVGLWSGTAMIVGSIIGSGIFISPGGVLRRSGSVAMSFVVWFLCGVTAFLGTAVAAVLERRVLVHLVPSGLDLRRAGDNDP